MRGDGPSEDGDQHVERQKDLRQTDPHKQDLLELPEATYETENAIKVHFSDSQPVTRAAWIHNVHSVSEMEVPKMHRQR